MPKSLNLAEIASISHEKDLKMFLWGKKQKQNPNYISGYRVGETYLATTFKSPFKRMFAVCCEMLCSSCAIFLRCLYITYTITTWHFKI